MNTQILHLFRLFWGVPVAALLLASIDTQAQPYSPPVTIHFMNNGSGWAEGSLGGTRNSDNDEEYIYCRVLRSESGFQQSTTLNCFARNAAGRTVSCSSDSDDLARGLAGVSPDAIISFGFDDQGICTSTLVYKSSSLNPKQ